MIYYEEPGIKLLQGDCLEELKTLPDESVDCVITSPPYYGLRDYGTAKWVGGNPDCEHLINTTGMSNKNTVGRKGHLPQTNMRAKSGKMQAKDICPRCGAKRVDNQIGLEKAPVEYVVRLVEVFREIKRVLKKQGNCWLNLGDSYAGNCSRASNNGRSGFGTPREKVVSRKSNGIKPKDLIGIPWSVAFALRDDGWWLRDTIIWHKPNPMPSSVTDRTTCAHEYIFLLTKSPKYYFDNEAIKEPKAVSSSERMKYQKFSPNNKGFTGQYSLGGADYSDNEKKETVRNKRSVWSVDSKYQDIETETTHRQGLNKNRGKGVVEKRDLPTQKEFVDRLRTSFTVEHLVDKTGLPKTHIEHWFRYDDNGFAYPSKEDWEKVGTDLLPELLEVYYETDEIDKNDNGTRNKRSVWTITTKPFKGSHFAVFPENLVRPMVLAGSPELICKKCGKPREKIYKEERINTRPGLNTGMAKSGKEDDPNKSLHNSDLSKYRQQILREEVGYNDCRCKSGWDSGVVLDPFCGSGTVGVVAKENRRDFIGIDLKPEYCEIAKTRIKGIIRPML